MKIILIIDPDRADATLSETLTNQGYQCLLAGDARTALAILESGRPIDLVVSETELPDMDGMDFLSRLHRTRPALPVIIVTAVCSLERYMQSANLGVIEYLTKPLYLKEFNRIVRFTLNQPVTRGTGTGPDLSIPSGSCEGDQRAPKGC